ncbi:hypothetical protein RLI31_02850, partial [Streptococcus pneumoniae]|nr:hypothetical protein [Streptococcus pneumoniae]
PNMASGNVAMRFGANGVCKSITKILSKMTPKANSRNQNSNTSRVAQRSVSKKLNHDTNQLAWKLRMKPVKDEEVVSLESLTA